MCFPKTDGIFRLTLFLLPAYFLDISASLFQGSAGYLRNIDRHFPIIFADDEGFWQVAGNGDHPFLFFLTAQKVLGDFRNRSVLNIKDSDNIFASYYNILSQMKIHLYSFPSLSVSLSTMPFRIWNVFPCSIY